MSNQDFTTSIIVDKSSAEAYKAINNVRGWWSENIKGITDQVNQVFDYAYKDVHTCKIKVIELVPGKKVVWQVLENYFNFVEDKTEWVNTKVEFDIEEKDGKTMVKVTHFGLVPSYECYDICHNAWTNYIQDSLFNLITTGKGKPNTKDHELLVGNN